MRVMDLSNDTLKTEVLCFLSVNTLHALSAMHWSKFVACHLELMTFEYKVEKSRYIETDTNKACYVRRKERQ